MTNFWYALACGISADAFPPLRLARRDRRFSTGRVEAEAEKAQREVKQDGTRGFPRRVRLRPCTQ